MRGAKQRRYNDRITLRTDAAQGTAWLDDTEARLNAIAPGWHFLATYLIAYIDRPLLIVPRTSGALTPEGSLHRGHRGATAQNQEPETAENTETSGHKKT